MEYFCSIVTKVNVTVAECVRIPFFNLKANADMPANKNIYFLPVKTWKYNIFVALRKNLTLNCKICRCFCHAYNRNGFRFNSSGINVIFV